MKNTILFDRLCYSYDGYVDAVHNLSLEIPMGCAFALLGRNGAGKTTALQSLCGQLAPDSGNVSIFGIDPYRDPVEAKSMLAYVSDQNDYLRWMTLRQNLAIIREFFPRYDEETAKRIADVFHLNLNRKLRILSLGQIRQFNLLAALARHPEVLILDEPTLGLDVPARRNFMELVIGQMASDHCTVIFSSHLIAELEGVIERFAVIDQGKLLLASELEQGNSGFFLLRNSLPDDESEILYRRPGRILVRGDRSRYGAKAEALSLEELFVWLTGDDYA